jgi:hypothetical protein
LIDHDRLTAISSPAWLAGLGLALTFLFGVIGGFSGFAVALAFVLFGQSALTIKQVSGIGLITATLGMMLGGALWSRLTWSAFREILGLGQPPARMYGKSRVVRKTEHATGYQIRFEDYTVHPGYWPLMAARAIGGQNMTHAWERYFSGRAEFVEFRGDMEKAGYWAWKDPDDHKQGGAWTETGLQFWGDIASGEAQIEPPAPRRGRS